MRYLGRITKLLRAGALTVTAVALLWLAGQWILHLHLLSVQTGSMRPMFRPGDALIMRPVSRRQLQPGVIVTYHSPRNPGELITHRIIWTHASTFQTKGDALTRPDPVVRASLAVGQVIVVMPRLGRALDWLRSWVGLSICLYMPALALAATEVRRLERSSVRARRYRLHGKQVVS